MEISASLVKQLRDETGAGFMECKKALEETGGDLEKAKACFERERIGSRRKEDRSSCFSRTHSRLHSR